MNIPTHDHSSVRVHLATASHRLAPLMPYLAFALLLTGAQLLPTLELARHSLRSGGLPFRDAVSFSLHPLLLGRSLLPAYGRTLSNEFVAYIGIFGSLLALIGAAHAPRIRTTPILALAASGLFLSLGAYNPMYWPLATIIPGFNMFRAPTRWLALWAIAAALLAGLGCDRLQQLAPKTRRHVSLMFGVLIAILFSLSFFSARFTPVGHTGPLGYPMFQDVVGWLIALTLGIAIVLAFPSSRYTILIVVTIELLLASLQLPINNLTTSQTYTGARPAMTHILARADTTTPQPRFLSTSSLLYDPGDIEDMRTQLTPQIDDRAVHDAIVGAKATEILAPNVPLTWKLPSVDGYGGGVLPLRAYAQFVTEIAGTTSLSPDGRLREHIYRPPPNWLMNTTNTRWLIADKLQDSWINHVFYDLEFDVDLTKGEQTRVRSVRRLQSTTVGLIISAYSADQKAVADLHLEIDGGSQRSLPVPAPRSDYDLVHVDLGDPLYISAISIESLSDKLTVHSLTLIDKRSGAFESQTLGPYRLAHSGDVKVYENLDFLPRAYQVLTLPLTPATHTTGSTEVREYTPTRVVIETESDTPTTLVLADAHYPGWRASVDGQVAKIRLANGFFRAVDLPRGPHEIVFHYQPHSWRWGLLLSGAAISIWIILAVARPIRRS